MASRTDTSPSRALRGEAPTHSAPPHDDAGEEGVSSGLIESPLPQGADAPKDPQKKLHDFADGGGSGGAEAFRRDGAHRLDGERSMAER